MSDVDNRYRVAVRTTDLSDEDMQVPETKILTSFSSTRPSSATQPFNTAALPLAYSLTSFTHGAFLKRTSLEMSILNQFHTLTSRSLRHFTMASSECDGSTLPITITFWTDCTFDFLSQWNMWYMLIINAFASFGLAVAQKKGRKKGYRVSDHGRTRAGGEI